MPKSVPRFPLRFLDLVQENRRHWIDLHVKRNVSIKFSNLRRHHNAVVIIVKKIRSLSRWGNAQNASFRIRRTQYQRSNQC